jgi:tight adherence protein B
MPIEPIYLLYGAIFLCVLLLVEGAYYFFIDAAVSKHRLNRRLSLLDSGMERREVLELLRRRPRAREHDGSFSLSPLGYVDGLIAQSGLAITRRRFLMLSLAFGIAVFIGLQVALTAGRLPPFLAPLHIQVILTAVLTVIAPLLYMKHVGEKRRQKFGVQLPEALDVIVRSLRAGHPINAALGLVSRELSDPIGTEFGIAVDEMTYGLEMNEALENLNDRIQVEDFNYVVMSINIQRESGGNLAGVLEGLSHVIRDRARMFMKVRALSSEGRMSAVILTALPFCVGAVVFSGNPDFYTKVVDDPLFLPIMSGAFINLVLGIYMIYRMVNFRF